MDEAKAAPSGCGCGCIATCLVLGADIGFGGGGVGVGGESSADQVLEGGDGGLVGSEDVEVEVG